MDGSADRERRLVKQILIRVGTHMGFTVHRPGGTKDSEFEAYARLLLQQGKDLGKLPRVPEPGTQNRWLYVWQTREQAKDFAQELRRRTRDDAWEVVQVETP